MAFAEGIIGKIVSKEIEEDQFGNKYRVAFTLQGHDGFYSVGTCKKDELTIKSGPSWVSLKEGDKVEFLFEQKDKFKNVKRSDIKLKASAAQAEPQHPPTKPEAPKSGTTTASKPEPRNFDNSVGITSGMAINNAVQIYCAGKCTFEEIEAVAKHIVVLSDEVKRAVADKMCDPYSPQGLAASSGEPKSTPAPKGPVKRGKTKEASVVDAPSSSDEALLHSQQVQEPVEGFDDDEDCPF